MTDSDQQVGSPRGSFLETPVSRRQFLKQAAIVASIPMLGGLAAACGSASTSSSSSPTAIGGDLRLVGWDGYEGLSKSYKSGVADWLKQNNLNLKQTPITSNDEVLTKLRAGGVGRTDLVSVNTAHVPQLVAAQVLQPIDYSRIANSSDLIPSVDEVGRKVYEINGSTYALPYFWGIDGMIYNATRIDTPPTSWRDVLKSEYKGKVVMLKGAGANFPVWSRVLGYDPSTLTKDQLQEVTDFLINLKKTQVRAIMGDMADVADIMARGDVWILASSTIICWPDIAPKGDKLAYVLPKEGGVSWIDGWAVAKDAPNLGSAYAYLDHMISPKVQVAIGDAYIEATVNQKAVPLMSESNQELYQYDKNQIGSDAAPFFQMPTGGGDVTDYSDWISAWQQVEVA
jgi:spermidine/putrescine transport system substrate-binding protein